MKQTAAVQFSGWGRVIATVGADSLFPPLPCISFTTPLEESIALKKQSAMDESHLYTWKGKKNERRVHALTALSLSLSLWLSLTNGSGAVAHEYTSN